MVHLALVDLWIEWFIVSAYSVRIVFCVFRFLRNTTKQRRGFTLTQAIDGAKEFYEVFAPWIWAIF